IYPIPLRLGFQVALKLNQKYFTVKIIRNLQNPNITRFICEGEEVNSGVLSSSSNAINTAYKKHLVKIKQNTQEQYYWVS
ncbi:2373_t:CDS:1, partial [Funneliformis caledonium]